MSRSGAASPSGLVDASRGTLRYSVRAPAGKAEARPCSMRCGDEDECERASAEGPEPAEETRGRSPRDEYRGDESGSGDARESLGEPLRIEAPNARETCRERPAKKEPPEVR